MHEWSCEHCWGNPLLPLEFLRALWISLLFAQDGGFARIVCKYSYYRIWDWMIFEEGRSLGRSLQWVFCQGFRVESSHRLSFLGSLEQDQLRFNITPKESKSCGCEQHNWAKSPVSFIILFVHSFGRVCSQFCLRSFTYKFETKSITLLVGGGTPKLWTELTSLWRIWRVDSTIG